MHTRSGIPRDAHPTFVDAFDQWSKKHSAVQDAAELRGAAKELGFDDLMQLAAGQRQMPRLHPEIRAIALIELASRALTGTQITAVREAWAGIQFYALDSLKHFATIKERQLLKQLLGQSL